MEPGPSRRCSHRNGKSSVHASTPLNWSVSYKRFGLTHGRHGNDETARNLTRRGKAGRLQDGIDPYLPISGHGECTVTRSRTKLPGPHLPTASEVDRYKGQR